MIRNLLTRKTTKLVEQAVVEPAKRAVQKSTGTGSDWLTKLLRLGIVGFLTLLAFRESPRGMKSADKLPENTSVVINNYIYDGGRKKHGYEPEDD